MRGNLGGIAGGHEGTGLPGDQEGMTVLLGRSQRTPLAAECRGVALDAAEPPPTRASASTTVAATTRAAGIAPHDTPRSPARVFTKTP